MSVVRASPLLVVLVTLLSATPVARAQVGTGAIPSRLSSSSASSSSSSPAAPAGIPWGTRPEHWLAAGGGIALGAVTVAIGTVVQRLALDLNDHALAPLTTQVDAASSAATASDYILVAEVLWSVGAALAGIALTWVIVLSFSTPAPTVVPDAAVAPTVSLRLTPVGVTLGGVF